MTTYIEKSVKDWAARTVSPGDRLLVAVSGGADSMGLLALLITSEAVRPEALHVLYVDHSLRPTAIEDAALVESYASTRGVKFSINKVDVPALARNKKLSVEHAARVLRYQAIDKTRLKKNCGMVVTAHTADDSLETILMKMLDGSCWYEWTGIPGQRGLIHRPLITVRRNELRSWVEEHGIPYREDETNSDMRFRRNRLRQQLKTSNFLTDSRANTILSESSSISCYLAYIRALSKTLARLPHQANSKRTICLEIERILQYFNELAFIPVEAAWTELTGILAGRLPSPIRRQINEIVRAQTPRSRLKLPAGIELDRRGHMLWLYRPELVQVTMLVPLDQSVTVLPNSCLRITPTLSNGPKSGDDWHIRNWQPGDRIEQPNRPRKKVSNLLCELKRDPLSRRRTLLLTHQDIPVLMLEPVSSQHELQLTNGTRWKIYYEFHE